MPDLTDLLPSIDGPHDPEQTRQMAALLPAVARWCNHATGNHSGSALQYSSDVNSIIGSLQAMAALLPQLHGQLLTWLQDQNRAGKIRIDNGGDPATALAEVAKALTAANDTVDGLYRAYSLAHRFTDTMGAPWENVEEGTDG